MIFFPPQPRVTRDLPNVFVGDIYDEGFRDN